MCLALTLNANIAEFDEYWHKRRLEAVKYFEEAYHPEPYNVTNHFNHQVHLNMKKLNSTRRGLLGKGHIGPCVATNPIDACWRCQPNWAENRKRLADCAIGFGKGTTGGKDGRIYVVTDSSDNDMQNPKPGTLRHAVIQTEPLWIIFARSMNIRLTQELIMTGDKTIDARGANVHIAHGAGITIQFIKNVIIHGLHIHQIYPGDGGLIRDSANHFGLRTRSDGDAISIFGASNIWIDHVSMARGTDGLIDIIQGSTAITISNCHMTDHNEVFLFGATNDYTDDQKMQVTVAFNHFGKGLVQRMPRARFGFIHVVNNDYTHWQMYAIGGSQHPTIISQGNRFVAPFNPFAKEVTKREAPESEWKSWTWLSDKDWFLNGAFFRDSGRGNAIDSKNKAQMFSAMAGTKVGELTRCSGPRKCTPGKPC
ncbi:probable pectate lyase P59 [Beta vulgaris subsp. vulgaris]|uniref:probable pectate lyase P59 n=1 Tax=Beta vulgaris subsp. vulgaris TaxID=3555 RepID=UPI00203754E7|nr:probable pectate lyase P59 [Beta vulgaris subsp. vulgaris]